MQNIGIILACMHACSCVTWALAQGGVYSSHSAVLPQKCNNSAGTWQNKDIYRPLCLQELLFGWPADPWSLHTLAARTGVVLSALGLDGISLDTPLRSLSDGFKRRAALAVALVRRPSLLLLDEPLAGLDWRSRADIASVLGARLLWDLLIRSISM